MEELITNIRVITNKTRANDVGSTDISVLDIMDKVNNQRSIPARQIETHICV
jgi:hypothetical protein